MIDNNMAIKLILNDFFFDEPQPMEEVTQAFEHLNTIKSRELLAEMGQIMFTTLLQMHLSKLKAQKLLITARFH